MPIEPINTSGFARNPLGIEAILERGTSAFGGIIRDMIQVGRDQANNQVGQERDFLAEQRREINLNQRRGENVLAQQNADRRFTEDTRQFDAKFGQGQNQFAQNIEQSNLDRVVRQEGQANQVRQGDERIGLERQSQDLRSEDLEFRRQQAQEDKTLRDEEHRVRLETDKLQLDQAKTKPEKEAAAKNYEAAKSAALTRMDELIKAGDTDAAKSFFNTTIESYDFDPGTKTRLAKQLGIEATGKADDGAAVTDDDLLTDDQLNAEIARIEGAVASDTKDTAPEGTKVPQVTEKTALRLSKLRQEQARRKNGPSFMDRYKQ